MKFLTLIFIAILTGCASNNLATEIQPPGDAFTGKNTPVVFEGVVLERLKSPRIWCGFLATFQGVRYRVNLVTSGQMQLGEQVVFHALVGPPLCERNDAILSLNIFRVGQRLRVKCYRTPDGHFVGWEQPDSVQILP